MFEKAMWWTVIAALVLVLVGKSHLDHKLEEARKPDCSEIRFAMIGGMVGVDCVPATAVAIKVWPKNIAVGPGESVQFYWAVLHDDGTIECGLPGAGCDSATALLPQDTAYLAFTILRVSNEALFDSSFYHLVIKRASTAVMELDTAISSLESLDSIPWRAGIVDTMYAVSAFFEGYWRGQQKIGAESNPVMVGYPATPPIALQVLPVLVDTLRL